MARKVIWTQAALRDLDNTARYIARDSRAYAASFVEETLRAAATLDVLGDRGRLVPEVNDGSIRELIMSPYRLIYKIEQDDIGILSVIHGARDLGALLMRKAATMKPVSRRTRTRRSKA